MRCKFSNELYALNKLHILYIENLTSKKKIWFQTFYEHIAD